MAKNYGLVVAAAWLCWLAAGCAGQSPKHPYEGYFSTTYQNDDRWLCKPGGSQNFCDGDLNATEVKADGTFSPVSLQAADDPPVDCFYVYPTVYLEYNPANHNDPRDVTAILDPLMSQAAPFNGLCRVYAPYYRQASIGCFLNDEDMDEYFDLAYRDVLEAFMHYMANFNQGRDLVIIGHSQGSMHLIELMQKEFDTLPALRRLLVSALLIGRDVLVPPGELVGGSFKNIPICQSPTDTGCVVSYKAFSEDFPPEESGSPGHVSHHAGLRNVCFNPAAPLGGKQALTTYFPRHSQFAELPLPNEVTEPFGVYQDFFHGECATNQHGFAFLNVSEEPAGGDPRVNPVDFEELSNLGNFFEAGHEMGLHLLDYNLALGNLLELVKSQIDSR